MKKLVKDQPYYETLQPLIGQTVTVTDGGGESATGHLDIFTASNGNEGWMLVGDNGGQPSLFDWPGNLPNAPYVIFSPRGIERVNIDISPDGQQVITVHI